MTTSTTVKFLSHRGRFFQRSVDRLFAMVTSSLVALSDGCVPHTRPVPVPRHGQVRSARRVGCGPAPPFRYRPTHAWGAGGR